MASPASAPARTKEQRNAQFLDFIRRVDPEADPTSILLFRQVRKVDHLLTHAAEKQLEIAGLSWPKFQLLLALQGNETYGTGGGLQPSELSELQGIPRNTVSELLASLEEEGLISRELHGTDRRKFVIRLTPQGRKTLKSKLGTQFREITKCFAALGTQERATLLELLTRLTQSLSEMNN
jgi:DNA-binding MarR family transcriptional regulator